MAGQMTSTLLGPILVQTTSYSAKLPARCRTAKIVSFKEHDAPYLQVTSPVAVRPCVACDRAGRGLRRIHDFVQSPRLVERDKGAGNAGRDFAARCMCASTMGRSTAIAASNSSSESALTA
jgi:hypothetical protein